MPKKKTAKPKAKIPANKKTVSEDVNQAAFRITREATGSK